MAYRYVRQWNQLRMRPMADEPFLDEEEARRRYLERDHGFEVVPDEPRLGDGVAVPRFVIHAFTKDHSFNAEFRNPAGSVTRIVEWSWTDDRLFRHGVIDYRYPDAENRYNLNKSLSILTTYLKPDGTSTVIADDRVAREQTVAKFTDVPTSTYWMDRPEFGDWGPLTDPEYGDHDLVEKYGRD
jgi:hypothetical protein